MGSRQQNGVGGCRGHSAQEVEETMGADCRLGYTASGLQMAERHGGSRQAKEIVGRAKAGPPGNLLPLPPHWHSWSGQLQFPSTWKYAVLSLGLMALRGSCHPSTLMLRAAPDSIPRYSHGSKQCLAWA